MSKDLWWDYAKFHTLALLTRDVDPVYPVLKRFLELQDVDPGSDDGLWLSVAHLTWYDMGSALRAWSSVALAAEAPGVRLRCATERRGNRDDNQLKANLASWREAAEASGSLGAFLTDGLPEEPVERWRDVVRRIQLVHGNGRWASYKLAEILNKVNGVELEFGDMGHANSSGPRQGLALLVADLPAGDSAKDVRALDEISEVFVAGLRQRGLPAPIEEVETTLCDFHALFGGRYYVGNDIDQMQGQLLDQPMSFTDDAFQARYDRLPHPYLGELGGWVGVDRQRQKAYRDTGEILVR